MTGLVADTPYIAVFQGQQIPEDQAVGAYPNPLPTVIVVTGPGGGPIPVTPTGGAGSLVNWANYELNVSHITAGLPLPWTAYSTGNFVYLNGAGTGLVFPPATQTLLAISGTAIFASTDNSDFEINWIGASSTIYGDGAACTFNAAAPVGFEANMGFSTVYDSAAGDTPLELIPQDASTTDPTQLLLRLALLSWATP